MTPHSDSAVFRITKRVYNLGLEEFFAWYGQERREVPYRLYEAWISATLARWRAGADDGAVWGLKARSDSPFDEDPAVVRERVRDTLEAE